MKVEDIKRANYLISEKEKLLKMINDTGFIKKVGTHVDWHHGSGVQTTNKVMLDASLSCKTVCEEIMKNVAQNRVNSIQKELDKLGVTEE